MIKNLIFDFGKVLVDYNFELFFHQQIPDEDRYLAIIRLMSNENIEAVIDRELTPFDEIMDDIISRNPDFEREVNIFRSEYPKMVTEEIPGMRDLLTRLKAEGYRLYGLTNWCSKVYQTMEQFPIFKLLDGQVISSEVHFIKPEPEIYQHLFERFGLNPEECIFADDREVNIEGGRALGMEGIIFTDAVQYERELREIISKSVEGK